jgi:hypothetical protein
MLLFDDERRRSCGGKSASTYRPPVSLCSLSLSLGKGENTLLPEVLQLP